MRIARIDTYPVRIPLKPERRMISALGRHEVSDFVLVKLTDDDGRIGVGEATVTPRWSGETVWGAQALIDRVLGPVLLGCDPRDIKAIDARMEAVAVQNWFAKAALEMACWDLAARAAGLPLCQLLGDTGRSRTVRSRFSLGAYEPRVAAERAVERVAAGFDTIKVKVGTVATQDVDRVRAVRAAIGPDLALTIDANGGWDEPSARWCLERLADCGIDLVEQPLERGNYTGLRRLRADLGVKVLADESCFDLIQAEELIAQQCCDVLSLYPGKHGGIARARRIAKRAAACGIPCSIGSNLEWDVGTAAMLHFLMATPNMQVDLYPGDCLGPSYHEFSIGTQPLRIEGPYTTLPDGPGLGIEVDWEQVEQHRLDRA